VTRAGNRDTFVGPQKVETYGITALTLRCIRSTTRVLADGSFPASWAGQRRWMTFRTPNSTTWPSLGFDWGLVPERLANRPGRSAGLTKQSRMAQRVSRRPCRICARRTSPAPGLQSLAMQRIPPWAVMPVSPELAPAAPGTRSAALCSTFVPNHNRARSPPGSRTHPEYYNLGDGARPGPAPRRNYTWIKRRGGDRLLRLRSRPVLCRLAGHTSAQPRQRGHAGRDARRAAEDRRAM